LTRHLFAATRQRELDSTGSRCPPAAHQTAPSYTNKATAGRRQCRSNARLSAARRMTSARLRAPRRGRVHTTKSNQTRGNRPATRVSSTRLADGWHVSSTRHMSEYKHSLTFRVRRCVVIATKSVHRLQIRPIVRNITGILYHSLKLRPGPCMRRRTDRQTDTHTHTDVHDQYTFRLGYASCEM